ncbi:MBL fold metallo-hydrolase [Clostridium aestuarii]|uniref:MBL fold metallo-hydrolase n=1 Tax=Clostridium aestuarii TaxID=338193 RepID=A0ABT4CWQ0_9CLOT|nr:MBL fold metallo-hydrolase [Clostridium aestuarii]MCY6483252.1 MBL fold metallo-hydrolase [Clostridium aestuarii]
MENYIKIKVYPASNGESILIECNGKEQTNILVDCGYISTYKLIKKDLSNFKKNKKKIDLLVLTHIDNDHINGARDLLCDYINDEICEISEIWYNDYFSIYDIEVNKKELCKTEYNIFKLLQSDEYPPDPNETGEKTISYKSANLLVDYLEKDKIRQRLNKSFENAVCIDDKNKLKKIPISNEVEIILLGPTKEILNELLYDWRKYLIDKGFEKEIVKSKELAEAFELYYVNQIEDAMEEIYCEKECAASDDLKEYLEFNVSDERIENRSSISFILKFYDKRLLFLGDSSPIDYEEILGNLLKNLKKDKLKFNLVKVSHHGSKYSTSNKFLEMITSKRYLISTNGNSFDHPDLEAISKIIVNQKEKKILYFNYRLPKVEEFLRDYRLEESKFIVKYENESSLDEDTQLIDIKGEEDELQDSGRD